MLKIGIIGAGRMGNAHAANLATLNNVKLSTVYDIDPEKSKAFVEKYPDVKILASAEEVCNSPETELIIITSPTFCHKEALLVAMATGKPIFCEKPLCRSREDLEELAPMIRNYKNMFAIGFVRRYSPSSMLLAKLIKEDKIGKLIGSSVTCTFGGFSRQWGDWFADFDKSGGVTLDMLAHHCDLQNLFFGKPAAVYAQAFCLRKTDALPKDYVSATLSYADGCICNMECSWLRAAPSESFMTVYGEKGSLKYSDADGLTFYDIGGAASKIEVDEGILGPLQDKITGGMYATEIAHIVDCALNPEIKPYAGAEEAIAAMEVCLAMLKSAETGESVKF